VLPSRQKFIPTGGSMIPLSAIQNDKSLFEKALSQVTPKILGSIIDHTQLNPAATGFDIEVLCREANEIGSFICINGSRISDAKKCIEKEKLTNIRGIAVVVGFPFGAELTLEKAQGAIGVLDAGADEVDMVLNYGKLLEHNFSFVRDDIIKVAEAVDTFCGVLKVIQENCCLNESQKSDATDIIAMVAQKIPHLRMFAKTSTGFGVPKDKETPKGATLADVWTMNARAETQRTRGVFIGVKAAGGIGDAETAVKMMLAGGCFDDTIKLFEGNIKLRENLSDRFRIGASAGLKIVDDLATRLARR